LAGKENSSVKHLKKLLPMSVLALAVMAYIGVASASAFTTWDDNGVPVSASENVTNTLETGDTLKLTDSNVPFVGSLTVTCTGGTASVTSAGTVGTGGSDTTTSGSATNCTSSNTVACSNPVSASAVNLPWTTQLSGTRDNVSKAGSTVGWKITCNNGLTDTCTSTTSSAAISNDSAEKAVDGTFDASTPKTNCTQGGTGAGSILGTVTGTLNNGDTLSAA
jgi:hypothetical protein